jgi:hypothetical protein
MVSGQRVDSTLPPATATILPSQRRLAMGDQSPETLAILPPFPTYWTRLTLGEWLVPWISR